MKRRWGWGRKRPIVALPKFYRELQNADCSKAGAGGPGATCGGAGNIGVTVVRASDPQGVWPPRGLKVPLLAEGALLPRAFAQRG